MAKHDPYQSILSSIYSFVIGTVVFAVVVYDFIFKYSSIVPYNFYKNIVIMDYNYLLDLRYIVYVVLIFYAVSSFRSCPTHLKKYKARSYGVKTELKWFRILKNNKGNEFKVWKDSFFFKGIGDIDAIISYKNKIHIIEIKSHFIVNIKPTMLLDKNNNRFKKDFLSQAYNLSDAYYKKTNVANIPILWFPNSKGKVEKVNGVIVVRGNSSVLFNTIIHINKNL